MKYFLLIYLLTSHFIVSAQELRVFEYNPSIGMISFSDVYRLSEDPDSLAIPDIEEFDKDSARFFELDSVYRKRFLTKTKISEHDSLYIYDYSKDVLISLIVKDLSVVASLNIYADKNNSPYNQHDYHVGFQIENKFLEDFENHYKNTLVVVDQKNPFKRNQLKPIVWQDIDSLEFPGNLISKKVNYNFGNNDFEYKSGQAYKFETGKHHIFIQKLLRNNRQFGLRLLATSSKNEDKIFERIYYSGEGSSFSGLNNQWFGRLFKGEPMVIFGFQWYSFGCPSITFIVPDEKTIFINCDNRHKKE